MLQLVPASTVISRLLRNYHTNNYLKNKSTYSKNQNTTTLSFHNRVKIHCENKLLITTIIN